MSKKLFIGANESPDAVARQFVLDNNGNDNDAAVSAAIATIKPGMSYTDASVQLRRAYEARINAKDQAGADAIADAMTFFHVKHQLVQAKADKPGADTDIVYYSFGDSRYGALGSGLSNRITADDLATERANAAREAQVKARQAAAEAAETARVAALSPQDKALEDELGKDNHTEISQVRAVLARFHGRTGSIREVRDNINNDLNDHPNGLFQYDNRTLALNVLKRQQRIENNHEQGFSLTGTAQAATPKPPAAKPATPAPAATHAAPAPAHATGTPAPAPAKPAPAPAHAAPAPAHAAPAPASHTHHWTPIEKQVQYDLETLGKDTGQPHGWKIENGVDSMDGKNGRHTGQSIADFLKDNQLTTFDAAAVTKLHTLAEAKRASAQAPNVSADLQRAIAQANTELGEKGKSGFLQDGAIDATEAAKLKTELAAINADIAKGPVSADLKNQVNGLLGKLAAGGVTDTNAIVGQSIKSIHAAVSGPAK